MKPLFVLSLIALIWPFSIKRPNAHLSWTPSTSPNVAGQNVLRAVQVNGVCGSFIKLNKTLLPPKRRQYVDTTVQHGTIYCYASQAQGTNGVVSALSNIAVANVK